MMNTEKMEILSDTKMYAVIEQDGEFVRNNITIHEDYALLYSNTLKQYVKGRNGFVKILSDNNKTVFRKAMARCGVKGQEVALGERTRKELNLSEGDKVTISHSNFICYYFRHSDNHVRFTSWITIVGLLISIIGSIFSILSFFVS